jgi:glycosyltransferase involved in cell wall biosynthesis
MKISHFNTHEQGGAAVVMLRLNGALRAMGHESRAYVRSLSRPMDGVAALDFRAAGLGRLIERGRHSLENRMLRRSRRSYYSALHECHATPVPNPAPDVVHLHWVNRWLDLPSFTASLPRTTPVVWTVHDMSPLAGGCFTDFGCGEFEQGCRRCPLLKWPADRTWAKRELARRKRLLAGRPVGYVANSDSTRRLVERSPLAKGARLEVIPPGLDCGEFPVRAKREAREALGIKPDGFVLGFAAAVLTDQNKGIDRFYDVAQRVATRVTGTRALVVGDGRIEPPVATDFLGLAKDAQKLNAAYAAMDALIVPSRMETFGQVSVEAQASGTPVWAFAVGGLPETLRDGESGELFEFGDTSGMADGLVEAAKVGRLESMGRAGAEWVRREFDSLVVARRYVKVYEELLARG